MNANVLRPEIQWIEGRCYRINDPITEITALQEHNLYENESICNEPEYESEDDDFEVVKVNDDRYSTSFHVSKHYIGSIIGKKGATKSRIEWDTKTDIKIPRHGQEGDIVIFGPSASNVIAARRRINLIVISSRMRQKSTHFVSIPLCNPEIMKNFEDFKKKVLSECTGKGLEESLFISTQKLHLTIGVMCLMDNEERQHACKLLAEAKENVIMPLLKNNSPLRIRVKGLAYMNDDPTQIRVLYATVQDEGNSSGLLQTLCDSIVDHFYKAGFMNNQEYGRENVKLHMTLMNTRYKALSSSSTDGQNTQPNMRKARETFDGTDILKKFADFEFGVSELTHMHLSMHHFTGPDGYYQSTCIIPCVT